MLNMIQFANAQIADCAQTAWCIEYGYDTECTCCSCSELHSIEITFDEAKTVTTADGRVWTMTHVQNVNVQFTGRSHQKFTAVSGWVFRSQDGKYSDMLLNSNPFGVTPYGVACEWMMDNGETTKWSTTVTIS